MSEILKLKYKVGQIEFEAEGPAEAVEQQRVNFMSAVLPAAVDAMVRTQAIVEERPYVEVENTPQLLMSDNKNNAQGLEDKEDDFSRTNLTSFLKKYGTLSDQDFVLFAAYFDEKKNGVKSFSVENVVQYYKEGRRSAYSNNSHLLGQLAKKGYIMDTDSPEGAKGRNYFTLTNEGIEYIKKYVPKDEKSEKKKTRPHTKKSGLNVSEAYMYITADDINVKNYPAIKSLSGSKEQVIMAMYIVANEGKGEWFTVDDVIYLLVNIFEIPANKDMVNGVFKRNKSMFTSEQDINNKKAYRRKLLSGAKDLAKELIQSKK